MGKRDRILFKGILVIILTMLLIWLIYQDEKVFQLEQPQGELVKAGDVKILLNELAEAGAQGFDKNALKDLCERYLEGDSENVSYGIYCSLLDCLLGKKGQSETRDKLRQRITYEDKYKKDFLLLKKDWYDSYAQLVSFYGLEDFIKEEKVEILCSDADLAGEERIGEGCLLGRDMSIYTCVSDSFTGLKFVAVKAYVRGGRLLALVDTLPDEAVLPNVWVMDMGQEHVHFYYEGYEILGDARQAFESLEGEAGQEMISEQVADIIYKNGAIVSVPIKNERIGGKLLSLAPGQAEVEGYGKLPIKDGCVGYKLYGELRKADESELPIGYDFADFVLEDGEVCAFLISREEKMETIRVAVKSDGFGSLYHDKLILACEDGMTVSYGSYEDRKVEEIPAGQELVLEAGSPYFSGERVEVEPKVNVGKIQVRSLSRSQGNPSYRGKMEVVEMEKSLALINEVLLEEYLYAVVPSEMPSTYPMEALKAQAVCARTYGYLYLKDPGYRELGAHVDDSVGYQVYNNMLENVNTTKAVKETAGLLLMHGDEPVDTYYYSTSCGFGADSGVWDESRKEEAPYLSSVHIAKQGEGDEAGKPLAAELSQEENFRAYISTIDEDAYEKDETWFRWHYQVEELDVPRLYEKLKARYAAGTKKILTYVGEGEPENDPDGFEDKEPEAFKEVYDIRCLKRKEGGVMDELLVETDKGVYKVVSEYNIRYVLSQGGKVIAQDGSVRQSDTILPSAYLAIDVVKTGESVVGYSIIGGGYGHGVGMSQNGAKAMAVEGLGFENILSFFYEDCLIGQMPFAD